MKITAHRSRIWVHLIILAVYGLVVIWLTRPLIGHLSTALAGSSTDAFMHYWNAWWVRQALVSGQSIFNTTYLFFPEGASLAYHNIAWLSIAPWLALQALLNDILAYNLIYLLNLLFCGYAAFLLAKQLTRRASIAHIHSCDVMICR